ncbi:MAG: hypothetical protein U5J62_04290 [Desulfurivibrio sp.]|nr:hypothetical protein [Desulfurivibrio sp.]
MPPLAVAVTNLAGLETVVAEEGIDDRRLADSFRRGRTRPYSSRQIASSKSMPEKWWAAVLAFAPAVIFVVVFAAINNLEVAGPG